MKKYLYILGNIKPDLDYYSIEVYGQPVKEMKKLIDIVEQNLLKNS